MASKPDVTLLVKRNTVKVQINDHQKYKAIEVIRFIEDQLGEDSVLACVPGRDFFDVTLINHDVAKNLANDGLLADGAGFHCKFIESRIKVVSFMNIPVYINDKDILSKLKFWGVIPVGEINRKCFDFQGKRKYDGTRFLKVEFPKEVASLPYATTFDGVSYAVRHNDQEK
ncbi:hypothetical protein LOTGIDRAFT_176961, partial [Lottia gigantea]